MNYIKRKTRRIVSNLERALNEVQELSDKASGLATGGQTLNDLLPWSEAFAGMKLPELEFPDFSISTAGTGPWAEEEFDRLIRSLGHEIYGLTDPVYIVVVGYEDVDIDTIRAHIQESEHQIQVYPQELFLSYLFTGEDPLLHLSQEASDAWLEFHPVLRELFRDDDFEFSWPASTDEGDEEEADEPFDEREEVIQLEQGDSPLALMGYKVGRVRGLPDNQRRAILRSAFEGEIPDAAGQDNIEEYMKQWGRPNTSRRLWRIARHLKAQINLRKPNQSMAQAIVEWRRDMDWLQQELYPMIAFKFRWPR